jgi:hypothetical protein
MSEFIKADQEVIRKSAVLPSVEEELEKALVKAEGGSFFKAFVWIWTAIKSCKWFIIFSIGIFLLYLQANSPISHYRGDLGALNESVSQLADILGEVQKAQARNEARLWIARWAKARRHPQLTEKRGSPATSSGTDTKFGFDTTLERGMDVLRAQKRMIVPLAGIVTATNTEELLNNVIALQTEITGIPMLIREQGGVQVEEVFRTAIAEIDLSKLSSIKSIPWLPDVFSGYLSYVSFRVLRDVVNITKPVIKILASASETTMDAIEAYLNMLYFEEINNLIEDIQQRHSAQSYMQLVYVLEERRYQMSSMRNARISTAAGMLNPAYEALDNALQGRASEAAAHAAIADFAIAVQKARSAFVISANPLRPDSSKKAATGASAH